MHNDASIDTRTHSQARLGTENRDSVFERKSCPNHGSEGHETKTRVCFRTKAFERYPSRTTIEMTALVSNRVPKPPEIGNAFRTKGNYANDPKGPQMTRSRVPREIKL
ncbi:hypothetical protein AVEN_236556-1 [Araneus ventricosus]|uniref:Uncharacterized protein n=1 Tax=Araneus ventricosus TaxID=182803 RepID=A0A4Y2LK24_ARAVE|nr:hypothetical protein AVEN_236556-1 [Araneus ventricosus]